MRRRDGAFELSQAWREREGEKREEGERKERLVS